MASKIYNKLDQVKMVFNPGGLGCPQHQSSEQGSANLEHALSRNEKTEGENSSEFTCSLNCPIHWSLHHLETLGI